MASVLGRIQSYDSSLTPSEVKVANYLKSCTEEAINASIHDVAKNSDVSVASVSRLAATLGYRDWKDLRYNLIKDSSKTPPQPFEDIDRGDSGEAVVKKIFDCSMLSLKDTFEQINVGAVIRVVEALEKAKRILFFGTGISGFFAMEEALRFAQLNPVAAAYSDEYQMVLQSSWADRDHVVFGFSNSGRSSATVAALDEARKRKALTVGIANYRNTPLEKVSDIYFCTSFPRVGEISSSLTARIALLCIMDSIFVLASTRGVLGEKVEPIAKSIDKKLRITNRKRSAGDNGNG